MPSSDLNELKRRLRTEGFEVYRTHQGLVCLAERVRDNLILDSGIALGPDPESAPDLLLLRVTLRAQATHFPGYPEEAVQVQARELAEPWLEKGYLEEAVTNSRLTDPGDPSRLLDTSHQVQVRLGGLSWEAVLVEVRWSFALRRASSDEG